MFPSPQRMAIHQAGHAVVQTLVGGDRFTVTRLALDEDLGSVFAGQVGRGTSSIDDETLLTIYEFGLVTLAGIAAENHYLATAREDGAGLVAISDLAQWHEEARAVLVEKGRIRLVELNIMNKLEEWFATPTIWQVVETLAATLLSEDPLEGETLARLLAPLGQRIDQPQ